jgi:N-acetylmuramoyl-L-alanine amidase
MPGSPGNPADSGKPRVARRRLIQGALGSLALSLTPHIARGATLLAVRLWPAPEYTRVTIEHDGQLKFHQFLLKDTKPLRMVVDIEGIDLTRQFTEQVQKVETGDPYLSRLRVGQFRPGVVRLVFELKVPVDPQVFALEPAGPYKNRLVVDLYPEGANDSLMALLRSQQNDGPAMEGPPGREGDDASPPALAQDGPQPQSPLARDAPAPGQDAQPASPTGNAGPSPSDATGAAPDTTSGTDAQRAPNVRTSRNMRRLITIAVDPGHGGEDPGAVGKRGTFEKVVTLSIGRQLASLIEEQSDYRVLMTRDADYFVPLGVRVNKARRVQADLFVSIHADAWVRSDARGSSVFALSERGASSSAAAELARQQNDADRIGGINVASPSPYVRSVVLDLATSAQISDSLRFGTSVLREIERVNRLHRGFVEQAGFAVLKAPDIPSILVETAFISNPDEEARLREQGYQRQMASAVFNGIRDFFTKNPPAVRNPVG